MLIVRVPEWKMESVNLKMTVQNAKWRDFKLYTAAFNFEISIFH